MNLTALTFIRKISDKLAEFKLGLNNVNATIYKKEFFERAHKDKVHPKYAQVLFSSSFLNGCNCWLRDHLYSELLKQLLTCQSFFNQMP